MKELVSRIINVKDKLYKSIVCEAISLAIKPVKGGKPPIDRRLIGSIRLVLGVFAMKI